MNTDLTNDSSELEDLFDSIAYANSPAPARAIDPADEAPRYASDTRICPAERALTCAAEKTLTCPTVKPINCPADKVINSVGQLTRRLHDTLIELGYDRQLQECAAGALPDARQRLAYVATLTEQAASRSLNAVELAMPVQERLAADAGALADRWDGVFGGRHDAQELKAVAEATRAYMRGVQARTDETRGHLREIMMAQEFQDLTGQVLKRVTELAEDLEQQLLMLLVENSPAATKRIEIPGALHGPNIGGPGASDAIADQAQVDALLESLGF